MFVCIYISVTNLLAHFLNHIFYLYDLDVLGLFISTLLNIGRASREFKSKTVTK